MRVDSRPGTVWFRCGLAAVLVVLAACGGTSDGDSASGATAAPTARTPRPSRSTRSPRRSSTRRARRRRASQTPAQPDSHARHAHRPPGDRGSVPADRHVARAHRSPRRVRRDRAGVGLRRLRRRGADVPAHQPGGAGRPGPTSPTSVNQPGDVSFVIDEVLAANDDPSSPLHGLVDPDAIGVVGHSLGGATTWAVSFDTATRDERIDSDRGLRRPDDPDAGRRARARLGAPAARAARRRGRRPDRARPGRLRAGGLAQVVRHPARRRRTSRRSPTPSRPTTSSSPAPCSTSGTAPSTATPRRSSGSPPTRPTPTLSRVEHE